jgi:hypothetical protein
MVPVAETFIRDRVYDQQAAGAGRDRRVRLRRQSALRGHPAGLRDRGRACGNLCSDPGQRPALRRTAPDEDFITGFPQEVEAYYRAVASDTAPEGDSRLAADCISTVDSTYLSAERRGAEVPIEAY